jgi:polysaccharide pyruvyl transferase WcaK-like protein
MNNRGAQALLVSDVLLIKELRKSSLVSVSAGDIEGVKHLKLPIESVLPRAVDIPHERADYLSKKYGFNRDSFSYKMFSLAGFIMMIIQTALLLFSIVLERIGLKGLYRSELLQNIKNSDLVVSTSDENFKETASLLPINPYWVFTWWSMLASRALDVMVARFFGKSVLMFPNSIGPFKTWIGRFISRIALESCDYIFIRDPISFAIVDELKVKTPKVLTYDTALLFDKSSDNKIGIFSKPVIGVSPGIYSHSLSHSEVKNYILSHAKALDSIIDKYSFSVVFLPHYISGFSNDDLEISKFIVKEMKNKSKTKIIVTKNASELKGFLDSMDIVLSSKMHPAILAASGYVPVFCVAYDHKQIGFFQRLELSECILNIRNISYEKLFSGIDMTWNKRDFLEEVLKEQIPKWKKQIKTGIETVLKSYHSQDTIGGKR